MTYSHDRDYGTERAARLIATVRKHLTPTEISDLIGARTMPYERDVYAAYAHNNPKLISGSFLYDMIEAYIDVGRDPKTGKWRSAESDDREAATKAVRGLTVVRGGEA